jgi:outer membrane receptor protein involved in Fe transport
VEFTREVFMRKWFRFTLYAAVLAAALVPFAAFAQTSRTTGALIGTVTDPQGGALPGVTVTATSPQLQGSRTAVTDEKGEYILPTLPPGTYHLEYVLQGLPTVTRDNVRVALNETTKLNVPMQLVTTEVVTVTANQVVVDPTRTTQQTNFNQEHLKYGVVGSANRSYQNVLFQAPEANVGAGGGSNPMVSGANVAQNTYLLDGINTTDPVTHTFGNNLAYDAIQEISIQTLGKDAEYSSSGGTVNVITRSGGNDFSGSFDWRYRNTRLQEQGHRHVPVGSSIPFFGAPPGATTLAFDKNVQPTMNSQPQLTIGGPIMHDRLWFFAALARPRTAATPPNLFGFQPGARTFVGWNNMAKLTFTPINNQTLTARFIDSYASIPYSQQSSFVSPEAASLQTQGNRTYGLTYDAILSPHWLANAQVGHTPARLAVLPLSGSDVPGVVDLVTGLNTVNYTGSQARTSVRDELLANTTYYLQRAGTHAFKIGFDGNRTSFNSFNNANGNPALIPGYDPSFCSPAFGFPAGSTCAGYIETFNGNQRINLSVVNPAHTVSSRQFAYFAQDEWQPITRLTIRAGVRYETVNWDSRSVTSPPDFKMWQPRLGAAFDVFNNASTVIHGYGGKIMDDNQLTLPTYGVQQPLGVAYFNLNPTTGKYTYDPGSSFIFASGELYDPNLKPSYSNQYALGVTQKIWRNTSIDVSAEYRNQKNLFEDYCGTLTAPLDNCVITNQPGFDVGVHNALSAKWRGLIARLESRPYNWLDLMTSWTHARSEGSYGSSFSETQNASTLFDFYPVHFTNTYGFLSDDARNRVKVDGYVRLPLAFTVGANYYWDDGTPWTVFQAANPYGSFFIEPRGSRRLPHYSELDMQVQKDFGLGRARLGLIAAVYNVMNHETTTAINGNAGTRAIADPNTGQLFIDPNQQTGANRLSRTFGIGTAFQQPRRFEVGARIEF